AEGFAPQTSSGILHAEENYIVPRIALAVATAVTDVEVGVSQVEIAEEQMKVEEKQRVLGVIPNFYVSYIPDAAPLTPKQKFKLAWKTVIDPVTIVFVGGAAGVQQAQNHFEGYGQGAQGYAKRFGAGYADTVSGTFIGGAILPSLFKQDPRYFYKGTGSLRSRFLYALANAVICKGDNRRWQANYSGILGSLAAGGISNLYYPAQDRDGAGLTFENAALGIGGSAISNLFQEFLIKKLTPKVPDSGAAKP
ncbi:MAG: carboxypeptidase regulatory-like domain-containing protein, partial [Candidatus Sulfotelmatobacter sp.]